MKKYLTIGLSILIILTLTFIFTNSLDSVAESQQKSGAVLERVWFLLEGVVGKGNVTEHLVRKLAHFVEFFVLGIEMSALSFLYYSFKRSLYFSITLPVFCGLLAALTDETIQIISERGSQVQDVWLDFSGICVGVAAIFVVWIIRKKRHGRQ